MIVKMKKVNLIIQEKNHQAALENLRRAGVVHIQRNREEVLIPGELKDELNLLEKALGALPRSKKKTKDIILGRTMTCDKAKEIIRVKNKENELLEQLAKHTKDIMHLKPWGEFDPIDIRNLAAKGVSIHLLSDMSLEEHEQLMADSSVSFFPIRKKGKTVSGMAVCLDESNKREDFGIRLPEYGIADINRLIIDVKEEIAKTRQVLVQLGEYRYALNQALMAVRQDIEFAEVKTSMMVEGDLAGFIGFVPADSSDKLKALAARESWGLMLCDPNNDDQVPTLVKSPPVIRLIQPIFRMMGILPGYHEPDISFYFLSFLSIFVAMILGDAAYGLIILALSAIVFFKTKKMTDTIRLIAIFGLATLVWGTVTGTWFSSLALVRDTPLKNFVIPAIATYQEELFPEYVVKMAVFPNDTLDATAMTMWISLFLGIVMISIARIQNFIRRLPSLAAIAQLGWLAIVLALYWLIMNIVLQLEPLAIIMDMAFPMIVGGLLVILVFGGQEQGHSFGWGLIQGFKGLLTNLLNTIGAFGDIISFIRLFAVGLVGVALAQSFNAMAPKGGGFAVIAAIVVLVFGHSLNLMLNALSVLVHGVRLNILEFSGHLDMEWTGFDFEPFRLRIPETESPETNKE